MTKAEKAEVIDFFSALLDHKVAWMEEDLRELSLEVADARRRIAALPGPEAFEPLRPND